ncbi:hypothetical protein DL771_011653 [Monosporascus sp. 5C6A]|nr:hypothetical protein DL771_011653 [Monosporascus sp. 5C6A]
MHWEYITQYRGVLSKALFGADRNKIPRGAWGLDEGAAVNEVKRPVYAAAALMYPESPRLESLGRALTDVFTLKIRHLPSKKFPGAREAEEFLESAVANERTADGGGQEADPGRMLAEACRYPSEGRSASRPEGGNR